MSSDAEARLILRGVDDATPAVQKVRGEMKDLDGAVQGVTASTAEANLQFLATAQALNQVSGGYDMMTTSLIGLNFVTEEQGRLLQQVGYFMKLFVGAGQMIQGVVGIMEMLRQKEAAVATIQAFRTALIPVAGVILVGIAAAAAALIGAKLAGWYQTSPGESRIVRETGEAWVHKGEEISRGGGGSGKSVTINMYGDRGGRSSLLDDYLLARRIGKEVARA